MNYNPAISFSAPVSLDVLRSITAPFYKKSRIRITQAEDNIMRIASISAGLSFREPISVAFKEENGYFTASYSVGGLIIAVAEESYEAMIEDFRYQISEAWDYYALEDDNNLSDGAKKVKQWLLSKISEV